MKKTVNESIEILKTINFKKIELDKLETFLPTLGMNNECLDQIPNSLYEYTGWGLKFWQYPNQLNELIKFISNLKIESYLEIGCRWGGTFIILNEVFKQNNPNLKSWALDLIDKSDILEEYSKYDEFTYIQSDSQNIDSSKLPETIDFVFIDGDHSYKGVKADYTKFLKYNPQYMMFHDISCPDMGVFEFWNEIKSLYPSYEFTKQYPLDGIKHDMFGIGIIKLR